MINGVGPTGGSRVTPPRTDAASRGAAAEPVSSVQPVAKPDTATNLLDAIVEMGPPVDAERIKAIRAVIAEGRYPIDPQAIAAKMIELDLPGKG